MCGSEKKRPCCCSEGKRKRVKHGRMPLPDLNYPPPSSSSSSSPSPSSSSSYNYDKLQLLGISCSSSSEDKKRVKHGKRPLPDLNYPPPPHHYQPSSPSLPSSSRPQHFDKLMGNAHEHTPAAVSKKRKMGESESESSSLWTKALRLGSMVMNYIISSVKKKKKDEPAQ